MESRTSHTAQQENYTQRPDAGLVTAAKSYLIYYPLVAKGQNYIGLEPVMLMIVVYICRCGMGRKGHNEKKK